MLLRRPPDFVGSGRFVTNGNGRPLGSSADNGSLISGHATPRARYAPVRHVECHEVAQSRWDVLRSGGNRHRSQRREPEGLLGTPRRTSGVRRSPAERWVQLVEDRDFSVDNIPEEVRGLQLEEFRKIVYQPDAHRPFFVERLRVHGGDVRVVTGHFLLWPKTPVRQSTVYSL
jgi:hypothetical protein